MVKRLYRFVSCDLKGLSRLEEDRNSAEDGWRGVGILRRNACDGVQRTSDRDDE